jgi:protein TonB
MRYGIASSALVFAAAALISPALASTTPPRVDASGNNQTVYPIGSQSKGEEGTVTLTVLVRPNGRGTKVKLINSSGFQDLDIAAIQTVMNWHFLPATDNGEAVSDWTNLQIVYKLPTPAKSKP